VDGTGHQGAAKSQPRRFEKLTHEGIFFDKHWGILIASHCWAGVLAEDEEENRRLNRAATILAARFLWFTVYGAGAVTAEDLVWYILISITQGTGSDLPEEEIERINAEVREHFERSDWGLTYNVIPNELVHLLDGKAGRKQDAAKRSDMEDHLRELDMIGG
jgi:hypothetical protein